MTTAPYRTPTAVPDDGPRWWKPWWHPTASVAAFVLIGVTFVLWTGGVTSPWRAAPAALGGLLSTTAHLAYCRRRGKSLHGSILILLTAVPLGLAVALVVSLLLDLV